MKWKCGKNEPTSIKRMKGLLAKKQQKQASLKPRNEIQETNNQETNNQETLKPRNQETVLIFK